MMFCIKCGVEIQEGWKVCPVCGYELDPRAEQENNVDTQGETDIKEQEGVISSKEPPIPQKNKRMFTIIIAAVLLVVIGGGVGATIVYPKVKQYQKVKEDQAVADKVMEEISSIKSEDISANSENDLDSIKTLYDKLTSAQKEMVSNYDTLDEAYKTLGVKKDEQVAQKLVDSINKIQGDKLSDSDTSIQELKREFGTLTENQKKLVTNSSKLDEYGKIVQKKKEEKAAKEAEEKKAAEEAARQEEERQNFSLATGTYVNEHVIPGCQALVFVSYETVDWMEVKILTMPETNTLTLHGPKLDNKTVQVTEKDSGIVVTMTWENAWDVTLSSSEEFMGMDAGIFNELTNTQYTLAPGFR